MEGVIEPFEKMVYLPFFQRYVLDGLSRKIIELFEILIYCHTTLGKCKELSVLDLHHPSGNMVLAEFFLEALTSNSFSSWPYDFHIVPPYGCGTFKVMGGKRDLILPLTTRYLQFIFHCVKPIVCFQGICCLIEIGRLSSLEVWQFRMWSIVIVQKCLEILVPSFFPHSHKLCVGWFLRWQSRWMFWPLPRLPSGSLNRGVVATASTAMVPHPISISKIKCRVDEHHP